MPITKDDASQALSQIQAAGGRVREVRFYAQAAPSLMIWGVVWFVCDLATQFAPRFYWSWPIGVTIGALGSFAVSAVMGKAVARPGPDVRRNVATWFAMMGFIVTLFLVVPIVSNREVHSIFGLVFGFLYVGFGLWVGWRMVALGSALVALTLFGFYGVGHWYPLYMGLVGGGALFLGGLWLQRI
jgi:hypothetical protein